MNNLENYSSKDFKKDLSEIWPTGFLGKIDDSISYLIDEYPDSKKNLESPIFIFSAGWRTGSTLLQRLINSNPNAALFGEAFEHHFLWHQLANQIKAFSPLDQGHACYIPMNYNKIKSDIVTDFLRNGFTANTTPPVLCLKRAHQIFIETMLKNPAENVGRKIWGIKLVRSDITVAKYFQWLYPNAKFLFIVRNPYEACNSCLNILKENKFALPLIVGSKYISNSKDYSVHWRHCISGFVKHSGKLNSILIKYEDLRAEKLNEKIEKFLNIKLDFSVLEKKVGGLVNKESLKLNDRVVIDKIAGKYIRKLNYSKDIFTN